jgi:hypothetical protein
VLRAVEKYGGLFDGGGGGEAPAETVTTNSFVTVCVGSFKL